METDFDQVDDLNVIAIGNPKLCRMCQMTTQQCINHFVPLLDLINKINVNNH